MKKTNFCHPIEINLLKKVVRMRKKCQFLFEKERKRFVGINMKRNLIQHYMNHIFLANEDKKKKLLCVDYAEEKRCVV